MTHIKFQDFQCKKIWSKIFKSHRANNNCTSSVCEMLVHYFLCLNAQFLLIPILLFLHKTNYFLNFYPGMGPLGTCSIQNRPRSIYQYSSMAPRLSGQNCKFFKFRLSFNSQKRLRYKENNTKYRSLTRKPRSHVRILIYRTWPI